MSDIARAHAKANGKERMRRDLQVEQRLSEKIETENILGDEFKWFQKVKLLRYHSINLQVPPNITSRG